MFLPIEFILQHDVIRYQFQPMEGSTKVKAETLTDDARHTKVDGDAGGSMSLIDQEMS